MMLRAALPFALLAGMSVVASAQSSAPSAGAAAAAAAVQPEAGAETAKASGALDGLVFVGTMDVDVYDAPFEDRLTFRDGLFHSEECQRACEFGAQKYYTRRVGEGIEFRAELICPDAPQRVLFEGRVIGDRIEGTALWTVERFYWTVQRHAVFSGTLATDAQGQAALAE